MDKIYAHIGKRGKQLIYDHLIGTADIAQGLASKIGLAEYGRILGLIHDFGKASDVFQKYLLSSQGLISSDEEGFVNAQRGEIDHSTAGAQLIYEKLASRGQEGKILAQFMTLAIASHHTGLIDCLKPDGFNEYERRINKDDNETHLTEARRNLPDIEEKLEEMLDPSIAGMFVRKICHEMKEPGKMSKPVMAFKHGLLARFLFSCLLEADRIDTAQFEYPESEALRNYGRYISWDTLIERLEARYDDYAQKTAQMPPGRAQELNRIREQVAKACLESAKRPKGIYQLTVPTGGGKTLASLRFALHHAQKHAMDRVFYIVPYTTLIDQNADVVRSILEREDERGRVILEHHSNFVPPEDTSHRYSLLAENWDAPIVFTTQVQFLEALFESGTRDARRMHQLANSVIIFDEVQTIPLKITNMFITALRFLVHDCGATVVLCTATQPPFDDTGNPYRELRITRESHIIPNEPELYQRLKRVEVHDERKPGGLTNAEIAYLGEKALRKKGSVLIVVNTRPSALALYQEIKGRNLSAEVYHLSTNMCPEHRMDKLDEIRKKLAKREPLICVSTQLIEAGVDIDFGAVIRALAGLDSIAQSAGRCNRNGMREDGGSVWVVNLQEENLDRLKDIRVGREYAQRVLDDIQANPEDFENDRIGLNAIAKYYDIYYKSQKDEMNYPVGANSLVKRNDKLYNMLSVNELSVAAYKATRNNTCPDMLLRQSFRTANEEFRVIDEPTRGVIVPYKDGKDIIVELCTASGLEKHGKLLKLAQRYSVNLYDHQIKKLLQIGAIQELPKVAGIYHLDERYYSDEYGWSEEPVNDMRIYIE